MSGDLAHAHVNATRAVLRKAADMCVKRGAAIEDAAIGAAYAAFDIAERHAGEGLGAIEWLRDALDLMERGIMDGNPRERSPDAS